jgi:hypothetical protein
VATLTDRLGPGGIAVGVALALLTWSPDALAQSKPPKALDQSAVAQYRESIPTSSGPELTGTGAAHARPLPVRVQATITREAGQKAGLLVKVSTSSVYGAPQAPLPRSNVTSHPRGIASGAAMAASPARLLESAGRGRVLGLLVVLTGVTAIVAFAAQRSRRMRG